MSFEVCSRVLIEAVLDKENLPCASVLTDGKHSICGMIKGV